jgi:hypothetical protein
LSIALVLEFVHFGKQIRNVWRVFKYGGEKGRIIQTDRVRNEEVLHRIKEERNILQTVKRRQANWIGQILSRN